MSSRAEIATDYDITVEEFYALTSDPGLHDFLAQQPDYSHRVVSNFRRVGPIRTWEVEVGITDQLPAAYQFLLGGLKLSWKQYFHMDLDTNRVEITVKHPLPNSILDVKAFGGIEPRGDSGCRVTLTFEVTSQVPLLGSKIETFTAEKVKQKWLNDCEARRDYIRKCRQEGKEFYIHPIDFLPPDPA